MWQSFVSFFVTLIAKVTGGKTPKQIAEEVGNIVSDEIAGLVRILVAEGVKDAGGFLAKLKVLNEGQQATGGDGATKKSTFSSLAKEAWKDFGGNVQSTALATVIDIGASLFHAKDKADEIGAPKI